MDKQCNITSAPGAAFPLPLGGAKGRESAKIVSLDVRAEASQMAALEEMTVQTEPQELRRIVSGIPL